MTAVPAPNPPQLHPDCAATNLPPPTSLFPSLPPNIGASPIITNCNPNPATAPSTDDFDREMARAQSANPMETAHCHSTTTTTLPISRTVSVRENKVISGKTQSLVANHENVTNPNPNMNITSITSTMPPLPEPGAITPVIHDDTTDSRPASQSVSPDMATSSASPSPNMIDVPHAPRRRSASRRKKKRKKSKKRCTALDYLSDSPRKKRGRKVKDKKHCPPIQKQPFFLVFPDLRLKCPQCDHIAICQGTLVQHLRTHPESRKCPVCSKLFSTQQNLIKHARLHTGERPYPCPIARCKWAYKQKGDLLAHIQRGKHGTSSDNNRKPPPQKYYHGSTKLPTLHAITREDVEANMDLKQQIIGLRKREEAKKRQKEKVKQTRKSQLDDFVLSMFLSTYDIDNKEMLNLLQIAKSKYDEKMRRNSLTPAPAVEVKPETSSSSNENADELDMNTLPSGRRKIKFKYLMNRVYGDYSIVLVPVDSVPADEVHNATPEIIIDPKLIPALQTSSPDVDISDHSQGLTMHSNMKILNTVNHEPWDPDHVTLPPPMKRQKMNNGQGRDIKELKDNNIILAQSNGMGIVGSIGRMSRKRQYHKYNQTAEGYWQCDAPNCGSLFLQKEKLEVHCRELHGSGYYGCKFCERIYRSQKNVQNHLKKAHNQHGDEYLNALIYNKFNQIIRVSESTWNSVQRHARNQHDDAMYGRSYSEDEVDHDIESNIDCNAVNPLNPLNPVPVQRQQNQNQNEKMVIKCIRFKTHPLDHVILREIYDSETESDGETNDSKKKKSKKKDGAHCHSTRSKVKCKKLVEWKMQGKSAKNGRKGPGRPTKYEIKSEDDSFGSGGGGSNSNASRRKRGRPKGSRNRSKVKKRKRSKSEKNRNKKRKKSKTPKQESTDIDHLDEFSDLYYDSDMVMDNIYDDFDSDRRSEGEVSVAQNEEAILMRDLKRNELLEERERMRRLKRKREDALSGDDDAEHQRRIKREKSEKGRSVTLQAKPERNLNVNAGSVRPNMNENAPKSNIQNGRNHINSHHNNQVIRGRKQSSNGVHGTLINRRDGFNRNSSNIPSLGVSTNQLLTAPIPHFNVNHFPDFSTMQVPTAMNGVNQINPIGINNTIGINGINGMNSLHPELNLPSISHLFTQNAPIPFPHIPTTTTTTVTTPNTNTTTTNLPPNTAVTAATATTTSTAAPVTPPTHSELNVMGILSQLSNQSSPMHPPMTNQDMMEGLQWLSGSSSQRALSDHGFNPLSDLGGNGHSASFASFNSLLGDDALHPINNMNTVMHNGSGAMLNNYGSIINNNYLLKKRSTPRNRKRESSSTQDSNDTNTTNREREGRESPLVPPLVDTCAGPGCNKTKGDDGGKLKMCGRCYSVKYCGKQCQMKHIDEHRKVCRKPEDTPVSQKRVAL